MMDMSIPVVLGTIVAEVGVVISSFAFSNYLNRSGPMKLNPDSVAKMGADEFDDATHSRRPPKNMSYKDEKESYFDHAATATQMKFERNADHE
jgi:hypothetical protein